MLRLGEIIKWKEAPTKRIMLKVIEHHEVKDNGIREWVFTLRPVYKPAPKSALKNKSVFSKNKHKLIN